MASSVHRSPARHAASFEAVRRQVFIEMQSRGREWLWRFVVPMQLALLGLFAAFGGSRTRALVMLVALPIGHASMLLGRRALEVRVGPFAWGAAHSMFIMALTGGIASPMLPMGIPVMVGAALLLAERKPKVLLTVFVAFGLAGLTALSVSSLGALPPPLATARGTASLAFFLTLACASVFSVVSVMRIGIYVTDAYARVAAELATRREELYEEGTDYSRALDGIAARVAHEVKNPLAAIKALSTHLARNSADAKIAERLGIVASEADRLQSIVDGFLTFSRGLGDLRLEAVRPYEIARELSLLLETRLAEQQLSMEVIGDERLELTADGRKLRQALLNLVLNAMHASPPGARITVTVVFTKDDVARIRVIDRGAGMAPEVLERIRRPYYSTREGGSGLGIAVARGVIEQHGGALRYDSVKGQGTTATIELPPVATPPDRPDLPRL